MAGGNRWRRRTVRKHRHNPHYAWFHHIPLKVDPLKRAVKHAYAQRRAGKEVVSVKVPMPISRSALWKLGKPANLGDKKIRLYGPAALAKMYGLRQDTISKWFRKGMLPEPFLMRPTRGNYHTPQWTYHQMRAITLVLNDIFEQGCSHYSIRYTEHIDMMIIGGKDALNKLNDEGTIVEQRLKKRGGKFGVLWL